MSSIDAAVGSVLVARDTTLKGEIAMAVQAKVQDAARQQGDAVAQLLEQAAQLSKAIGSGENFDDVG